jgi:hypothetical protein
VDRIETNRLAFVFPVSGNVDEERISTSHIERMNLNVRTYLRRFTRLALGFSKSKPHLEAAVALFVAWYNFCRLHRSLRVTPAMEAGVADRLWTVRDIAELLEQAEDKRAA